MTEFFLDFTNKRSCLKRMVHSGVRKRVVSKRVVLADVPWTSKFGTRVQKKERQTPKTGLGTSFNSVQTRCIVKARLRKVHFSGDFLGFLIFSGSPVLLEFHKKTFKFNTLSYSKLLPFYSKTFQDGNDNGNFREVNSNDFRDGNWESMDMKV